ncbi:2'-5' RNA ligase [Limihaloglobus sulfuriphilus]|uniref:RNA 2',3'-cyclic phosphodiesterase n=1 Tax=Limihaloglobus sulfuriphilus TaxID=1851148 RepID=A0A1Q2MBX7_9BACT|nr:RNA 2',3'-cyclic phosphodiesterase [Limihaloglobus sulfuriphilus]AQQ70160.1 2'-5' RNA ligase [Limihaloglobus sulfuriphilus]
MSDKYRLFTAVEIDSSCRKRLESAVRQLKQTGLFGSHSVKWVEPENMHITLNFLGDTDESEILQICRCMDQAAQTTPVFDLGLAGLGQFGRGRVVFADVVTGGEEFGELSRKLTKKFTAMGFSPPQKQYKGHLTICRAKKNPLKKPALNILEGFRNKNFGLFSVFLLNLYSSRLTSAAPVYTLMHSSRLSGAK